MVRVVPQLARRSQYTVAAWALTACWHELGQIAASRLSMTAGRQAVGGHGKDIGLQLKDQS